MPGDRAIQARLYYFLTTPKILYIKERTVRNKLLIKSYMEYPEVNQLYKYCAYNTNSLSILINKKIWVAKPASLNDPFDCKIKFKLEINSEAFSKYLNRTDRSTGNRQKDYENFLKGLQMTTEDISNFGVFSMSQIEDNILMWSHYANHHKGFCIGFVRKNDNLFGDIARTQPVEYDYNYPEAYPLDENGNYDEAIFKKMLFTKAKDWEYEKEWRLIYNEGDKEEPLLADISSIIFGLRMSEGHKDTIRKILADKPNIRYQQAIDIEYQFRLKIIDL
jgi:Protein of unknown function (DUF2971)